MLWINFAVQLPIAIALGFDKPLPGLMERKPRPLSQPVLSRSQWARIIFLGLIIAFGTLALEAVFTPAGAAVAATMGFAVFSLYNVATALSARDEFHTMFNRDTLSDRRQLMLYGSSLALAFVATELSFLQRLFGTTSLRAQQWLICIGFAVFLILVDEVIKFFLLRRRGQGVREASTAGTP